MKKVFSGLTKVATIFTLALAITNGLNTPLHAQNPAPRPEVTVALPPASVPMAALQFESTTVNFGRVNDGQVVPIVFKVKNITDKDVKITRINPGCGCTAAEGNPSEIKAGAEAEIKVKFSSAGRLGTNIKSVTVMTDDPAQPNYTLEFRGEVVSLVMVRPVAIDMGILDRGATEARPFSVIYTGDVPMNITSVTSENPNVTVKAMGQTAFEEGATKGTEYLFEATLLPTAAQGDLTSRIVVTTDLDVAKTHYVAVRGRIEGDYTFRPARLMAVLNKSSNVERQFTIMSRKNRSFEVEEVKHDLPIEVTFQHEKASTTGPVRGEEGTSNALLITGKFTAAEKTQVTSGKVSLLLKDSETGEKSWLEIPTIVQIRDPRPSTRPNLGQPQAAATP